MQNIVITPREVDQRKHDMKREEIQQHVREFEANGGKVVEVAPGEGIHRKPDWNNSKAHGLCVATVAHQVGVHFWRVYQDIREGNLDFYLVNGTKHINPSDVPNYKRLVEARRAKRK